MIKLFGTANEKYLREVEVYHNSTDGILYYDYNSTADTQYTNAVTKAELINLFKKGILVINDGTGFVRPTNLTVSTNYASVSYTIDAGSDKADTAIFYSKGYSAS